MSGTQPGEPIRCLVFSASLRAASFNTVLARLAAREIEARGGRVDLAAMKDFDSPSYEQDVQFESGFPRVEGRQHRGPVRGQDGQVGVVHYVAGADAGSAVGAQPHREPAVPQFRDGDSGVVGQLRRSPQAGGLVAVLLPAKPTPPRR